MVDAAGGSATLRIVVLWKANTWAEAAGNRTSDNT